MTKTIEVSFCHFSRSQKNCVLMLIFLDREIQIDNKGQNGSRSILFRQAVQTQDLLYNAALVCVYTDVVIN